MFAASFGNPPLAALGIAIALGLLPAAALAQAAPVMRCDALAASPFDPDRVQGVAGVTDGSIDSQRAIPACQEAHEAYPRALRFVYQLGRAYDDMDDPRAVPLMREAAEAGHSGAQRSLGIYYRLGFGVSQDARRAVEYFTASAEAGNMEAAANLAAMYAGGEGVATNPAKAVSWSQRAAEAGVSWAMINLGDFRQLGFGLAQDYELALDWYRQAYAIPHRFAQPAAAERIAYVYLHGKNGQPDMTRAKAWFEKAKAAGSATADAGLAAVGLLDGGGKGGSEYLEQLLQSAPKLSGQ